MAYASRLWPFYFCQNLVLVIFVQKSRKKQGYSCLYGRRAVYLFLRISNTFLFAHPPFNSRNIFIIKWNKIGGSFGALSKKFSPRVIWPRGRIHFLCSDRMNAYFFRLIRRTAPALAASSTNAAGMRLASPDWGFSLSPEGLAVSPEPSNQLSGHSTPEF